MASLTNTPIQSVYCWTMGQTARYAKEIPFLLRATNPVYAMSGKPKGSKGVIMNGKPVQDFGAFAAMLGVPL